MRLRHRSSTSRVTDQAGEAPTAAPHAPDPGPPPSSRRALLTSGAAAMGAVVATGLANAMPAAAATSPVRLGTSNSTSGTTSITSSGSSARAIAGKTTKNGTIAVSGTVTGSDGIGVRGYADAGSSAVGVYGRSKANIGVTGNGGYAGVTGITGVYGGILYGTSTGVYGSGATYGGYMAGTSYGVYGSGSTYGVYGTGSTAVYGSSSSGSGTGVYGLGGSFGVRGNGTNSGVRGDSAYVGVWSQGASYGVYALATGSSGQNYGLYAATDSAAGFAIYSDGNCHVGGTLSKAAGSFRIDHPLAPEQKWLQHSFVESPDMMNIYNGNVTTNAKGVATVRMPAWFRALNHEFRYQLTVIGTFAQAIIDRELSGRTFRIRTTEPNVKVSWQVTGIRQDAYAKAHPIKVEVRKRKAERGSVAFAARGSGLTRMRARPDGARSIKRAKPAPKLTRPRVPQPDAATM